MDIVRSSSPEHPTEVRDGTFSGTVLGVQTLSAAQGAAATDVVFLPGARTHWHTHEHGQILRVTAGSGWVCADGEEPMRVNVGDTVWAPAGERHWHGASETHLMAHLAVSLGTTSWHEAVDDAEYPTRPA